MDKMQSFKTNDNVTLKYVDTGPAAADEDEKPWLILVRLFSFGTASNMLPVMILSFEWQYKARYIQKK